MPQQLRHCDCRTTEFLIDPAGFIFRCHSDLYANRFPIGHILDPELPKLLGQWVACPVFGKCNACDIKVKFNRFQEHGHSSVEIRNIGEPYAPNTEHVSEVVNTYGKQETLGCAFMKTSRKVLIIKTGFSEFLDRGISTTVSLGDVLICTSLLHLYKQDEVTWVTDWMARRLLKR